MPENWRQCKSETVQNEESEEEEYEGEQDQIGVRVARCRTGVGSLAASMD
jgi:hypothetical protein